MIKTLKATGMLRDRDFTRKGVCSGVDMWFGSRVVFDSGDTMPPDTRPYADVSAPVANA
jgi:hypothetical protein